MQSQLRFPHLLIMVNLLLRLFLSADYVQILIWTLTEIPNTPMVKIVL